MTTCQIFACTLKGPSSVIDYEGRNWGLCVRHAQVVDRAVIGRFILDVTEQAGKGERVWIRSPARYSGPDWEAHYRLLEQPDHAIRANGAAFAVSAHVVPRDVLICSCSWRGHFRMWPQHVRDASTLPAQVRPS